MMKRTRRQLTAGASLNPTFTYEREQLKRFLGFPTHDSAQFFIESRVVLSKQIDIGR
jgi:hypothetical protein